MLTDMGGRNDARAFNNGGSNTINNWNTSNVEQMQICSIMLIRLTNPLGIGICQI